MCAKRKTPTHRRSVLMRDQVVYFHYFMFFWFAWVLGWDMRRGGLEPPAALVPVSGVDLDPDLGVLLHHSPQCLVYIDSEMLLVAVRRSELLGQLVVGEE